MAESNQEKTKSIETVERLATPTSPLVFLSHDTRDAELAEAFSKLLTSVSAGILKSFRSSDKKGSQGIEYGAEWYPELMGKLNEASDIVCLLTPRSLDRPWILYEAGVAKGKLNTPVYGVVLGIPLGRAHTGPFAQFQNCDDDEESLTKLVIQLLARIPNSEPDRDAIQMQVKTFKQRANDILKKLGDAKELNQDKATVDETSVAKLFEEVKVMFQDLPSRIEATFSGSIEPMRRKRMRRFDPILIDDMLHMSDKMNDPIGLLIIFSYYRDEFPWLYELGMELYRTVKSGNPAKIDKAYTNFMRTIDFASHASPIILDSKESYMMLRELPRIMDRSFQHYMKVSQQRTRKEKQAEE
jgi:hypothetical protein